VQLSELSGSCSGLFKVNLCLYIHCIKHYNCEHQSVLTNTYDLQVSCSVPADIHKFTDVSKPRTEKESIIIAYFILKRLFNRHYSFPEKFLVRLSNFTNYRLFLELKI
jgi:hypothetical protein